MIPGVPAGKLTLAGLSAIVAAPPLLFKTDRSLALPAHQSAPYSFPQRVRSAQFRDTAWSELLFQPGGRRCVSDTGHGQASGHSTRRVVHGSMGGRSSDKTFACRWTRITQLRALTIALIRSHLSKPVEPATLVRRWQRFAGEARSERQLSANRKKHC
jgi:hypothetical protein